MKSNKTFLMKKKAKSANMPVSDNNYLSEKDKEQKRHYCYFVNENRKEFSRMHEGDIFLFYLP